MLWDYLYARENGENNGRNNKLDQATEEAIEEAVESNDNINNLEMSLKNLKLRTNNSKHKL